MPRRHTSKSWRTLPAMAVALVRCPRPHPSQNHMATPKPPRGPDDHLLWQRWGSAGNLFRSIPHTLVASPGVAGGLGRSVGSLGLVSNADWGHRCPKQPSSITWAFAPGRSSQSSSCGTMCGRTQFGALRSFAARSAAGRSHCPCGVTQRCGKNVGDKGWRRRRRSCDA